MSSGNDLNKAQETYGGFTGMVKWGAIGVLVVVAIVIALISH